MDYRKSPSFRTRRSSGVQDYRRDVQSPMVVKAEVDVGDSTGRRRNGSHEDEIRGDKLAYWINRAKLVLKRIARICREWVRKVGKNLSKFRDKCLRKWVKWSDPKLEPYRMKDVAESKDEIRSKMRVPTSQAELMELIRAMPKAVLSARERAVIATVMSFPMRRVQDLMLPKTEITYVDEDEVLGPLTLDKLYRSGFAHFPVINWRKEIIGVIHTEALNSLEVKEASRARDILDPKVCYLRDDYTLLQALAAFYRTNCYFFLVIDPFERIVGLLTYQMLADLLLGGVPNDDFDRDNDRTAVAKRKITKK